MFERHDSLIGGFIGGVGLIVLSLWYWSTARSVAADATSHHPALVAWAVRLAATAGLAAAQFLFLTFVVSRFFRPDRFDLALRVTAAVVFSVSLAGAFALALLATFG